MGQHLFAPPNVKGWEGGTAWLNTATIVVRHNLAYTMSLGGGALNLGDPDPYGVAAIAVRGKSLVTPPRIKLPDAISATIHIPYDYDSATGAVSNVRAPFAIPPSS